MRTLNRTALALTLSIFTFCISPVLANDTLGDDHTLVTSVADLEGSWDYTAEGVDPNYSKGVMHISKEAGKHIVKIVTGDLMMTSEEISIDGNNVNFVVYADQERIEVSLVMDGDSFTGQGTSSQGPFSLKGTKQPEHQ